MAETRSRVACILAAGTGSRLKSLTDGATKCMVRLNGTRLVDLLLADLKKVGYASYVFVIGHQKESLVEHLRSNHADIPITFIVNEQYASTNNIYSLFLATERLRTFDEVHLFESDVFIKPSTLVKYLADEGSCDSVLVSPYEYWMDGTCVTVTPQGRVEAFISKRDVSRYGPDELFKTVNCYKFSADFFNRAYLPFLRSYIEVSGRNSYYEEVLKVIMPVTGNRLSAYAIAATEWMEIDDAEDLRRAEITAETVPQRAGERLVAQYGGYWKSKGLRDLTLLENPFFPPAEFLSEFAGQLKHALTMYPSTQAIISGIASKTSDIEPANIAVGNGASELINTLFSEIVGDVTVIQPTFLEYKRVLKDRQQDWIRTFPELDYASALSAALKSIRTHLILVNPNNPTGETLSKPLIVDAARTLDTIGKYLIVDESFIDFSDQESCADRATLNNCPNMLVLRSYGKSYGVGGVRLGCLYAHDRQLIAGVRARLPIWNISSFAEVFLDILPKYKAQYAVAMRAFKDERMRYFSKLKSTGLTVHESGANFLLAALPADRVDRICDRFLERGMLIKRLERPGLNGTHIRIAIKDRATNDEVAALLAEQ